MAGWGDTLQPVIVFLGGRVNLKEIIEEVHSQLDYNPELQSYKDSVARAVSRHYVEISNSCPWLFMQTVTPWTVRAPVTGTATQPMNIGTNTRSCTITAPPGVVRASWAGGLISLPDNGKYRIISADPSTGVVFFNGEPSNARYLGSSVPNFLGWTVTFDREPLPVDCAEPLGFMDRQDQELGRLLFIDRRREEELFLNANDGGQVFVLIEDDHIQDPPPQVAPTAALIAGGTLSIGVVHEYCYTIMYEANSSLVVNDGRESPPSVVVVAPVTTAGNRTVVLSGLDNTTDLGVATNLLKNIYRRDKTNNGKWVRIATGIGDSVTSFTDPGGSPAAGVFGHVTFAGQEPRQYVRAYYTAQQDSKLELRYLRKPRRLVADSDTPEWPEQYHYLLVSRALQDICMQHGMTGQSTMYERRGNEVLQRMKGKWLARSDKDLVRQGFTFGGQTIFERYGNPTKIG